MLTNTNVAWVSIHAPHTEGDLQGEWTKGREAMFQSTPPTRRATRPGLTLALLGDVSIHAPHTEGDRL